MYKNIKMNVCICTLSGCEKENAKVPVDILSVPEKTWIQRNVSKLRLVTVLLICICTGLLSYT